MEGQALVDGIACACRLPAVQRAVGPPGHRATGPSGHRAPAAAVGGARGRPRCVRTQRRLALSVRVAVRGRRWAGRTCGRRRCARPHAARACARASPGSRRARRRDEMREMRRPAAAKGALLCCCRHAQPRRSRRSCSFSSCPPMRRAPENSSTGAPDADLFEILCARRYGGSGVSGVNAWSVPRPSMRAGRRPAARPCGSGCSPSPEMCRS